MNQKKSKRKASRLPQNTSGESMTVQYFKDAHNPNEMLKRYIKGHPINVITKPPVWRDWSEFDYQENAFKVAKINQDFGELSATLRNRFKNNPEHLLQFLADPDNRDEATRLGFFPASELKSEVNPDNKNLVTDPNVLEKTQASGEADQNLT